MYGPVKTGESAEYTGYTGWVKVMTDQATDIYLRYVNGIFIGYADTEGGELH